MANYNPSTIARIADINAGIKVETGILLGATYFNHAGGAASQHELFTVKGRIILLQLFHEVITTDFGAQAAQAAWNATFSSVAYTVQPIGTKCASVSGLKIGHRVVWGGGVLATAATVTTKPYLSDYAAVTPMIIGGRDSVGTIGMLGSDATLATGSFFCSLRYIADSEGAYVEALV
jgi:hypothetical protein